VLINEDNPMDHNDHMALLRDGLPMQGGLWADLGSGTGAFTLALAEILGPETTIYSVDQDARALKQQAQAMAAAYPRVTLHSLTAAFKRPLDMPPLDGIVMANSLHFHANKDAILRLVHGALKPDGRLLIVEYNTDRGNTWVPYPFAFPPWKALAHKNGFTETRLLSVRPSRFLGEIYSAASLK